MKKYLALIFALILFLPSSVNAREFVYEWYIKDIDTEINILDDGSLDITEKILADCGNLPDKHGIFRVIPTTKYLTDEQVIDYKIVLKSITDFDGNKINYTASTDSNNDTVTWKIGDKNITVTGENEYLIKYNVGNVIQGNDPEFDEFYWNVHGQFWDMEADSVKVTVNFPPTFDHETQETNLYGGNFGENDVIAHYKWTDKNTIEIESARTFSNNEGLTLSVTMPKGMVKSANVRIIDNTIPILLGILFWIFQLMWLAIPPIVLVMMFAIWIRYGKDPKLGKTVVAQYNPPLEMNPMQIGMLMSNGNLDSRSITASIVNLAVKKLIRIEELDKKGWFDSKDFRMTLLKEKDSKKYQSLAKSEKDLIKYLFGNGKSKKLSALKNKFYKHISSLKTQVRKELLDDKQLFEKKGFAWKDWLFIVLIICVVAGFFVIGFLPFLGISLITSAIIMGIFSYFMPKLTIAGAEAQWESKGFKLFMTTAEKYRSEFYEKEFIFEKFLPFAIVYNIVSLWTKNMKAIYGEEKMNSYSPYWYYSTTLASGFNVDAFSSTLDSMSSNMSSSISSSPSSSGSGGGGFSGGGGGGGGGGGW